MNWLMKRAAIGFTLSLGRARKHHAPFTPIYPHGRRHREDRASIASVNLRPSIRRRSFRVEGRLTIESLDAAERPPFRILSLDGGGAKGFYTLGVLREVEGLVG